MFRRVLHSVAASVLVQTSLILIQLISVPLLIHYWGVTYYGEWLLLFTIPSYLSLSDVGLVSALSNELLISISKNDQGKAIRQLGSGITAVFGIGGAGAVLLVLGLHLTNFTSWLHIDHIEKQEAWLTLLFLMFYVILCLQQELMSTVPRAEGHNARGRVWITVTRLIEFGAVVGLVSQGHTAWIVAMVYATIRGISWCAMFIYYRSYYNWVRQVTIGFFSVGEIRHLVIPSLSFLGFSLANAAVLQGSTLLIGVFLTPVHVVIYTTLRTLSNFCRQITSIMTYAVWPEFTRALAIHDISKATMLHRRLCQIALWVSLFLFILLETTGDFILKVWTKGAVAPQQPVFTLLLLSTLPYNLWNTSATTAISVNRHQAISTTFLVCSFAALALASLLLPRFGLAGIAISFLLSDCIMLIRVFKNSLTILSEETMGNLARSILLDFKWLSRFKKWRNVAVSSL